MSIYKGKEIDKEESSKSHSEIQTSLLEIIKKL